MEKGKLSPEIEREIKNIGHTPNDVFNRISKLVFLGHAVNSLPHPKAGGMLVTSALRPRKPSLEDYDSEPRDDEAIERTQKHVRGKLEF